MAHTAAAGCAFFSAGAGLCLCAGCGCRDERCVHNNSSTDVIASADYSRYNGCVMQKKLSQLLAAFPYYEKDGDADPVIEWLAFDSRDVRAGTLFFALPGTHTTGAVFIPAAVAAGACAVVYEGSLPEQTVQAMRRAGTVSVRVESARFAMSPASAAFYDNPSGKLRVIGVTGTEGKSSTVSFIWQLLCLCGKKAGFISTVQYSVGGGAIDNAEHQTTPEAPVVQRMLHEMVCSGCEYAVVEASSHGLSRRLNRLGDVAFDVGVMMNVTHEHLEFHGTREQYCSDKANLFRALDAEYHIKNGARVPVFGVVNADDHAALYFRNAACAPVAGFSVRTPETADLPDVPPNMPVLYASGIVSDAMGTAFLLRGENGFDCNALVQCPLPGAFNANNLLAALIVVSRLTQLPLEQVAGLCAKLMPVRGRMTEIDCGQPYEVIVDYAHTPSSFEQIFPPIRSRVKGKIISVFGSGGERDIQKRPVQGRIAAVYSDIVLLCDEDPRGEKSAELLSMIAVGCREAGMVAGKDYFIIPPRQDAIRFAFGLAEPGDAVLLLGKAHENSIIYKDYVMPYDEIGEAVQALGDRGFRR